MKKQEIVKLIVDSAERFGARNTQRFEYLHSRLSKEESEVLAEALLAIFSDYPPDKYHYERQELAGFLLDAIAPACSLDLEKLLSNLLPNYNLSVEQLPHYLATTFGTGLITELLTQVLEKSQDATTTRAAKTMIYWLRG